MQRTQQSRAGGSAARYGKRGEWEQHRRGEESSAVGGRTPWARPQLYRKGEGEGESRRDGETVGSKRSSMAPASMGKTWGGSNGEKKRSQWISITRNEERTRSFGVLGRVRSESSAVVTGRRLGRCSVGVGARLLAWSRPARAGGNGRGVALSARGRSVASGWARRALVQWRGWPGVSPGRGRGSWGAAAKACSGSAKQRSRGARGLGLGVGSNGP
jgi:hypothetical protein